jgi:hypothetical protein
MFFRPSIFPPLTSSRRRASVRAASSFRIRIDFSGSAGRHGTPTLKTATKPRSSGLPRRNCLAVLKLICPLSSKPDGILHQATVIASRTSKKTNSDFLHVCAPVSLSKTGSYVATTGELVASHMMVLETIGNDHHALVSRYVSEPVLAEVAAEATGTCERETQLKLQVHMDGECP